jgi:hypothetical protein
MKKVLIGLVVIILVVVAIIATRPAEFKISRSANIGAPADVVFAQVNDFHNWDGWSPWAKLDPAMKTKFEGAQSGTGAMYSWTGNDKVGEGKMTITDSKPTEKVAIKLEFIKPFAATNTATFDIKAAGDKSDVTWSMEGHNNFMAKAFSLFMNMDQLIGKDFEKGLAQMKTVAETESQKRMAEAKAAADKAAADKAAADAAAAAAAAEAQAAAKKPKGKHK